MKTSKAKPMASRRKAPNRKTSLEIGVTQIARVAGLLRDQKMTWEQIASAFGISENTLRTVRKNAKV